MIKEKTADPATPESVARVRCWCGLPAECTTELTNARLGTGRFPRCQAHARRDVETGDFKLVASKPPRT